MSFPGEYNNGWQFLVLGLLFILLDQIEEHFHLEKMGMPDQWNQEISQFETNKTKALTSSFLVEAMSLHKNSRYLAIIDNKSAILMLKAEVTQILWLLPIFKTFLVDSEHLCSYPRQCSPFLYLLESAERRKDILPALFCIYSLFCKLKMKLRHS